MRIFLTGAAGLIGGEVAQRLVARGHAVTAGVHLNREVRDNTGALVPLAGLATIDLAAPALGLTKTNAAVIATSHELIIHCAATVRFDLADADYQAINVGGTAAVLALAARGDLPLLHVSTAYVCGIRDGPVGEHDPLPAGGFANGYEASKAAAEALVAAASPSHVIARPSIVVGDSRTGAIRSFDTTYALFKLIAEGRIRHLPACAGATLDFVPIDHVAGGLVALAEAMPRAAGGRYHLVSGAPIAVGEWAAAIGAYPQFTAPVLVDPGSFDPAALPPAERRLFARVAARYASYFQRDPRFDDTQLRASTGLACPPTGAAFMRRLIDHSIGAGFLRGATGHADSAPPTGRARRTPTSARP